jgi:hypothetical protein
VLALGLSATAAGAAAASTSDLARTGVVSFYARRQLMLLNGPSTEPVDLPVARGYPHELDMSGDGGVLLIERSLVERIDPADPTQRWQLRLPRPHHGVLSPDGGRTYISRAAPAVLSAIRVGAVGTPDWTLALPGCARALALDGTGRWLFAAYGNRVGHVAVIDTAVGRVTRQWVTGKPVAALRLSRDGGTLYALNRGAGQVSAIRVADGVTQATVKVGAWPSALALAPDDAQLYVAEPRSKTVAVVSGAELRLAGRIVLPGRPHDVGRTPDGAFVVVTSPSRRAVYWVDTVSRQLVRTQRFRRRPWRVVFAREVLSPPTVTPTPTVGGLEVPTPTPTTPPGGTPTSSPTSISSATPPPTETPLPAATPTDTPTATATSTLTPTHTPAPPGMVVGAVYDDGTAQPLSNVLVLGAGQSGTNTTTSTNSDGHYTLPPLPPGDTVVTLSAPGYTRAVRHVNIAEHAGAHAHDARLTSLGEAVVMGPNGGTVVADFRSPRPLGEGQACPEPCRRGEGTNAAAQIELEVASNTLPDGTQVQLTPLSPQGLIAPVPLGWSVLLGVDIEFPSPVAISGNGGGSGWGSVRVPLTAFGAADAQTITAAIWDDIVQQWRTGPPGTLIGDTLEIPVPSRESPVTTHQLALLVADATPAAPPPPVVGKPIQGVGLVQGSADSGSVTADPLVILAGTNGSAFVLTRAHSTTPLPSGTLLRVDLREHYTLRDGSEVPGTVATEEVVGYQLSPSTSASLAAYFRLVPSRNYGLGELRSGQVDIALSLAEAAGNVALIDSNGGTVNGPSGLRLVVPPHAVTGGSLLTLVPVAPASLPAGAGTRADFVGAFTLQVSGGVLDPLAAYDLGLGTTVADGEEFVVGRWETGVGSFVIAGLGHSAGGDIVVDACPSGLGGCLSGLTSGEYAVFTLPAATALVAGTVADSSGPRSGIAVTSDQLAVVSIADASGHYVLPAPVGVSSTLTARDAANDLSATADVVPSTDYRLPVTVDLLLHPSPPQVIQINPPNHASQVERSAVVTVTFSKAIDLASVSEASALLLQTDSRATSTSHEIAVRRSLSADGTQLVITPTDLLISSTVYELTLTSAVSDRHGNGLQGSGASGQGSGAFVSDFTTSPVFKADVLPPNTLRVSLPVDGTGNVPPIGTVGRVFVCGGANLAAPGTAVVVQNATSQVTYTASATDANGVSGSEVCDVLFPGRCDTSPPGSFCAVVDAAIGDKVQVQVQDVLHNTVTLDAGNMTDERTGATAIGPDGGRVVAVEDSRYSAEVPAGAFDGVRVATVFPIRDDEFPARIDADSGIHHQGAVFLDLGDEDVIARQEISLTIPAPPNLDPDAQILVGQVINFRGRDELTLVDTGSYRVNGDGQAVLSTNSPPFPGARRSGYYNFSTPDRSVGYVLGVVDKHLSTAAMMPSPLFFIFPYIEPELTSFAMPVLADEPVTVSLQNVGGEVLDQIDIVGPPVGEFVSLPRPLSDDPTPVAVEGVSIPNGETGIDTQRELDLTFSRAVNAGSDGRLPEGAIEVRDDRGNLIAGTWAVVSADGRRVRFFPLRPFPPGRTVGVTVVHLEDTAGNVFSGFASSFATFAPVLVASLPIASNDVDLLQIPSPSGTSRAVAVVARNGDSTTDSFGGIVSVDVRNARAPVVLGEALTPGTDRAVRVVSNSPPRVVSVDAAGNPQRYGTIRAFDFSDPAVPVEVGRRVLNLSPQAISEQIFLQDVPTEGGVPLAIALIGTDAAYVANPPVIGIQQVTLSRMIPPRNEIEGMLNGEFRVVAALRQFVLAAGQHNGTNEFLVLDATLTGVRDRLPLQVAPMDMLAIPSYPIDFDGDGNLGVAEDQDGDPTTAADEISDLVVTTCEPRTLCVLRLDASGKIIATTKLLLPASLGGTRGGAVDPQRRLLYLAAGTAGLAAVDFNDPLQAPSAGDPILAVVPLSGQAKRVRLYTDARGIEYALVATDESLDVVQVTPGEAGLSIYDTNNGAVIPERFEESDGTFILVNNDNDDADVDANGTPILDKDDIGRVEGEDDLRRLDIKVPMTDGIVTLDMPSGTAQARLWLTADRDGAFPLPQRYDLGAGQGPPETVWIEGIAPSAADRDVRITFHWEPPPGSPLLPFDDAVTATVVELDYIPGRHPTGVYVDPAGERKTSFFRTKHTELRDILAGQGQPTLDDLPQANFGGVRIRGVDSGSIAEVTVRAADETSRHGAHAPTLDETLPTDLTLVASSTPRTLISREDLMVYTGVVDVGGAVLGPADVRDRFRPDDALPLNTDAAVLANTAVLQRIVLRTPSLGEHPPLLGGGAGAAALEIIDAQAFASQISAGVRGSALYDEYLAFDAGGHENFTGMEGALADRWSRLIVQLVLPATDPHTSFDFHLMTDPPSDQAKLGSNHRGDGQFPFGMLSLTGFDGLNADETAPEQVTPDGPALDMIDVPLRKQNGRRVTVVTFTPPGSFPFNREAEAGLTQSLTVSLGPSGSEEVWAKPSLLLVRPPVVFVHGLTGSPDAWGEDFLGTFERNFVFDFVDYASRSVSGFDTIFTAVPQKINELLTAFRTAHHDPVSPPARGEGGARLDDVSDRKIAATQVDIIGHSMGGLATRWFVTDDLSGVSPVPRQITYPTSAQISPSPTDGIGFLPIRTDRAPSVKFKQESNFTRGSIRKVVTLASPQLGSPLANYVTHEICHDDASCYTSLTGKGLVLGALGFIFGEVPFAALGAQDFGNAIYDLSQGSAANKLLQDVPSAAVPVHAVAVYKDGADLITLAGGAVTFEAFEGLLKFAAVFHTLPPLPLPEDLVAVVTAPGFEKYCPGFGLITSDIIVPVESARYGNPAQTNIDGFTHMGANQSDKVAEKIRWVLYDQQQNTMVNSFNQGFPAGQPAPLNCR